MRTQLRVFQWLAWLGWAVVLTGIPLRADLTNEITQLTVTNYTGYLIASDALNNDAGYNRDRIGVQAKIRYGEKAAAGTGVRYEYRLDFQLIDSTGAAVVFNPDSGSDTNRWMVVDDVDLSGAATSVERTYSVGLRPATRLNPEETYRVRLVLARRPVPGILPFLGAGEEQIDTARRYLHFNSTVSADAGFNAIAVLDDPATDLSGYGRTYLVATDPDKNTFTVIARGLVHRYDGYLVPRAQAQVKLRFTAELRDAATDAVIAVTQNTSEFEETVFSYNDPINATSPKRPATHAFVRPVTFRPQNGIQLDSRNKQYKVRLQVGHYETAGANLPIFDTATQLGAQRLLHFNGNLLFGNISALVLGISNDPAPGTLVADGIRSTLAIEPTAGIVNAPGNYSFGGGPPLNVVLMLNGTARLESGSVPAEGDGATGEVGGVRYRLGNVQLTPNGATADVCALLPTGLGWATTTNSRILENEVCFSETPLKPDFTPNATELGVKGPGWFVEETKPIWFEAESTTWTLANGQFAIQPAGGVRYVRAPELEALTKIQVDNDGMRFKLSNEQYWRAAQGMDGPILVRTGASGQALVSATTTFSGGAVYRTHFPHNALVVWTGGGSIRFNDDLIVPAQSALNLVAQARVGYDRDCQGEGCGPSAGIEELTFEPLNDTVRVTRDGGFQATGQLASPTRLHWGYIPSLDAYAQETDAFAAANLLIPGIFLRGGQTPLPSDLRPAELLYSGFDPTQDDAVERSRDEAYDSGLGDYAGLNFRVGVNAGKKATSVIAGKTAGPWDLTGRSKYYVRRGGVSGIHEAVNGTFPPELTLYGYPMTFTTYGLSYLDSRPEDSRTDGSVAVPYPSNFTLKFDDLLFNCVGAPTVPKIPEAEQKAAKVLEYWAATFHARAMEFDRKAAASCDPTQGFLLVGLETSTPTFEGTIAGSLAFLPNGAIVTRQDDKLDPPYDGRLKMPTELSFKGPTTKDKAGNDIQEEYPVTPVNDAYLNAWKDNVSGQGFLNVAGKLGVPFFEDVQVHLHTGMKKPDGQEQPPLVYLMGGWPDEGFGSAEENFFTQSPYDLSNRGFPADRQLEEYRSGLGETNEKFRPRSRQKWLGVVKFDYAMKWDPASRSFKGVKPDTSNFLVIKTSHELLRLTARHAELKLGAQFLGLDTLNLDKLALAGLEGLEDVFTGILSPQIVQAGTAAMNEMLDADLRSLFEPSFEGPVGFTVEQLITDLKTQYDPDQKTFKGDITPILDKWLVTQPGQSVLERFRNLANYNQGSPALLVKLRDGLSQATNAVGQARHALQGKDLDYLSELAEIAKRWLAKRKNKTADKFANTLDKLAERVKNRSEEVDRLFENVQALIKVADDGLGPASEITSEITKALQEADADFLKIANQLKIDLANELGKYQTGLDDPFANESALRRVLLQKIEDRFFAGTAANLVHRILKNRFYDVNAELRAGFDSLFEMVNGVIVEALTDAVPELAGGLTDFLGDAGQSMAGSRIDGYAHIKGDSLTEARVDLHLALKFADQMKFDGFVRIRELDSENTAAGCLPPGGLATEVTAGAEDVKLEWISTNATVSVNGKFVFDGNTGGLLGMGSGFQLKGGIDFKGFKIDELGASMMIGKLETYFSAQIACTIGKGWKANGGVMFGKTCTLDPFFWDTGIKEVLGEPPFTGAYGYGEAHVPVSQLLGLGDTCLIRFGGGLGLGVGYFIEGPTFVGKFHAEVTGEALCIIQLGAEMTLLVAANPEGGKFIGDFKATASLGYCPICISKTVQRHIVKSID